MNRHADILKHCIATVMVIVLVTVHEAHADGVRLRNQAVVQGRDVRLADIAKLDGPLSEKFSDVVVATFSPKQTEISISLAEVRSCLEQQEANWAQMSLRGYAVCKVQLHDDENSSGYGDQKNQNRSMLDDPSVPRVAANPDQPIDFHTSLTVRDRIREWLEVYTDTDGVDLQIGFHDRDKGWLDESVWRDRVVIEPVNSQRLGTVIIEVHRFRGETKFDSQRMTLKVSRRVLAVVATRSVRNGQTIVPGDVAIQEVYLEDADRPLITNRNEIIGQRAAASMREGMVFYEDSVRLPVMIQRGETVSVRSRTGDLMIKMICRANEEGSLGDVIELRNEATRKTFTAKVTGPREAELNSQAVAAAAE